jgi:peroxiredoxin
MSDCVKLARTLKAFFALCCCSILWLALLPAVPYGAESPEPLPASPETAWADVEKAEASARPRPDWRDREPKPEELAAFQKQVQAANAVLARKAREFTMRFPTNENVSDARFLTALALKQAVAAGDGASEAQLRQFVDVTVADTTIPEEDRVGVFLAAGNLPLMKKLGMRYFIEGRSKFSEEFDLGWKAALIEARKKFPNSGRVYSGLLALADRSKDPAESKKLAAEIVEAEGASVAVKTYARHILNGTKPFEIGKPLDVRFTALDGRGVDLAKLKGKVVLVDFWATDCGPCVGEMPRIKAAYEKLHERGFEIIGISLDEKESALRKFVREKNLTWPQYFDGQGWENKFAVQYGIFAIPTMWLVDKRGNLRDSNVGGNLDRIVSRLLDEKP